MVRLPRMLLAVLCTLGVWMCAGRAFASGPICEADATSDAVAPTSDQECDTASPDRQPGPDPAAQPGGLCANAGASMVAPTPLLIAPQLFIDAPDSDATFSEARDVIALGRAPRAAVSGERAALHALVPNSWTLDFSLQPEAANPIDARASASSGVKSSLERPPRHSARPTS